MCSSRVRLLYCVENWSKMRFMVVNISELFKRLFIYLEGIALGCLGHAQDAVSRRGRFSTWLLSVLLVLMLWEMRKVEINF